MLGFFPYMCNLKYNDMNELTEKMNELYLQNRKRLTVLENKLTVARGKI